MCAIEYYTYDDYKNWEGDWELIDGKYDKQGDFSKESYEFKDIECEVTIDFDHAFKRYR